MIPLDIDRDEAANAAKHELGKPIYDRPSPLDRLGDWVFNRIRELELRASDVPGGWFTVTVTIIIVLVAVVLLVRIARRSVRSARTGFGLLDTADRSAAEHRAAAETCAAQDDWESAIRHRLRAVARQLEERTILEPVPGRTANELAQDAGRALPSLAEEFRSCTDIFNDVSYGDRPGTPAAYRQIVALDEHIRDAPLLAIDTDASTVTGWEVVR